MPAAIDDDLQTLEQTSTWLPRLGEEIIALIPVAACADAPLSVREPIVIALNYMLKVEDLVPEGVEALGQLDRAVVLRVACQQAARGDLSALEEQAAAVVQRLADEAQALTALLDSLVPRLAQHLENQRAPVGTGRSIAQLLDDAQVRAEWAAELTRLAASLRTPAPVREARVLAMQRAFFAARLPK